MRTRCSSARRRRCRSRSTRRCSTIACSTSRSTRRGRRSSASCSSSRTASSIDRYVSACRKAGINLAGIDLEAFALLRALGAPADREGSALVAVAIGHDRSTFAVSDGRICEFTRVVEWGGSALNVALARAFDSTPSEVETMKRGLSLDGSTTPEELTPEQIDGRARRRPATGAVVRARARLVAAVLPKPAGQSRHRRDRAHGRHRASAGSRGGARAPHRRARARR